MVMMPERKARGFTLIELLVVMAIVATLLAIVAPRYFNSLEKSKETALRQDLSIMREAIGHYYSDHNRYPGGLEELVQHGYLRQIPVDPITGDSQTWVLMSPPDSTQSGLYDIASGAQGTDADGTPYSSF
jgi:general secretion pathway protein G